MAIIDEKDRPQSGIGSWKVRRRFMFAVVLFCMYCILWIMHHGQDGRVNETIVTWAFACIGMCVGSYVFGAAWQDINFKSFEKEKE